MRRYCLATTICLFAVVACGDDTPLDSSLDRQPANPVPANNAVGQSSIINLTWTASAGHNPRFDVYLGVTDDPPRVARDLTRAHYAPPRLSLDTRYYWRVVQKGRLADVDGPLWEFTTSAGTPPDPPSQPGPADQTELAAEHVTLHWSSGADEDSLEYDVYFGDTSDPLLLESSLDVDSLVVPVHAWTIYYWRVVARNRDGLSSSGPVWQFYAGPVPNHMYNRAGTGETGIGTIDELPLETMLFWPQDIAFDVDNSLIVVDWNAHRVLKLYPASGRFGLLAGAFDGIAGNPCAPYPALCDIGASDSRLNHPTSILVRPDGKMVLSAWHNSTVFLIDPLFDSMVRITGTGVPCYNGDDRSAVGACNNFPSAAVYDLQGRLCFTDQLNQVVRRIENDGTIHTMAGTAPVWDGTRYVTQPGFTGDEGPATSAKFRFNGLTTCGKLCIDSAGNIYIADTDNHAIRMVDTNGIIHRVAGLYPATPGSGGDGGPATAAMLNEPRDVACDTDDNLYIADTGNHVIRMVTAAGIISTVAGIPGVIGDGGDDGGLATETGLNLPFGIEIDHDGNLWIADTENSLIRMVYR